MKLNSTSRYLKTRKVYLSIVEQIKFFSLIIELNSYEGALDEEFELLNILDSKDYEQAYHLFKDKIESFKILILDPDSLNRDKQLPIYLRNFSKGSIYTKILSIFAFEVLQRLKKYQEANEIFEFLLYKQNVYRLSTRSKWFERLAINYETHLKDPVKSFKSIKTALEDQENIIFSGRLNLFSRLEKMSQTKKYLKIKEIKEEIERLCIKEKYDFTEAPCVEIQGTLLHTSEFIPGRKNVFIDSPSKNSMTISVEQVAINHYVNNMGFTHAKHAETTTLTTLFGILFWDIIWNNSVFNVFVDKFQHGPLDLQTKYFYENRKEYIEKRLNLFRSSSIEDICLMASNCWDLNFGYQCYGVNFELFESLEEFLSLLKCFRPEQLVNLCEYVSKNYRYCRSGGPDLVVWSDETNKIKFVEVKGPGDHLSYKQMIWLDFMLKNSIECEVCHVKGLNSKRLR